jgi:5-methylcytosine-specific restriction enzyme subunit McrC
MTAMHDASSLSLHSPDWVLREYEQTPPLDADALPATARRVIANEINHDAERLRMKWLPDGRVQLCATQHVGIVALPDGPTLEIRPKAPGANLLEMLQYAHGVRAKTIDEEAAITPGERFITAIATLYEAELADVLQRGLLREYRERTGTEQHVRGRLEVQRQLQRQGPQPTQFECRYDELTTDIVLNQAILYATTVLLRLVDDRRIGAALQRHQQTLRRTVELRPVRPIELEDVELSRLANYYTNLYRLTQLILRSVYADELHVGERATYSILVDMNKIFEAVVERAVTEALTGDELTVRGQVSARNLVWGGAREISIRPDIIVEDGQGVILIGDAKWKLDSTESPEPSNEDLYQLVSYQVAHDAPGVLFYPAQEQRLASQYSSNLDQDIILVEIPIRSILGQEYRQSVVQTIRNTLRPCLGRTSRGKSSDSSGR